MISPEAGTDSLSTIYMDVNLGGLNTNGRAVFRLEHRGSHDVINGSKVDRCDIDELGARIALVDGRVVFIPLGHLQFTYTPA